LSKEKLNEKDLEQNIEEIPEYKPGLVKTLNVVAGILFIILILVIYLPAKIWKEEETVRNVGRYRMTILNHVEDLYKKNERKLSDGSHSGDEDRFRPA